MIICKFNNEIETECRIKWDKQKNERMNEKPNVKLN